MADTSFCGGDIFELEGDAIVNPARDPRWTATGVGGALERRSSGIDQVISALRGAAADEAFRAQPRGMPAVPRR